MMEGITERMELNSIDQVYVAYTHMDSSISQTPRVERLLPLLLSDFEDIQFRDEFVQAHVMYEPDPVTVINALVPQYVMGHALRHAGAGLRQRAQRQDARHG